MVVTEEMEASRSLRVLSSNADTAPLGAAWTQYYRYGQTYQPETPHGYAIISIKEELRYNGYGKNIVLNLVYGSAMLNRVKEFQAANGLIPDGVIGPRTLKALSKKRVAAAEAVYGIPGRYICKQFDLESGFDYAAVGYIDKDDRGPGQINRRYHPDVSDAEAHNLAFSATWSAAYLRGHYGSLGDWDAALAAHNIGLYYARKWLAAGKPPRGVFTTGGTDIAEIATRYVALVKGKVC